LSSPNQFSGHRLKVVASQEAKITNSNWSSIMKLRLSYLAILSGVLMLHGCGGGGVLGKTPTDTDTMVPTAGTVDLSILPHPPANAVTLTTDEHWIYDSAKKPVILRGANLLYGDSPATRINGITVLKDQGSNMVRLLLTDKTTDVELEGALNKVIGQGMIAVVSLTTPVFEDASKNTLTCTEKSTFLLNAIDTLWLGKWLPVLSEDKFQAGLMINVANGWGPVGVFNPDSFGYQEYIETYKAIIGKFRTVGFKVPMVIDAPSCGQDFNAFLSGRTRELQAADSAKNIVLGVHADGNRWSNSDKISNAATALYNEKAPFILTGFTGSGVADIEQLPIDHMDLIQKSLGDAALAFNFPWGGTADAAAYSMKLDAPLDLRGGAGVSFYVFLDKLYGEFTKNDSGHYIQMGKLAVGAYLVDAAGNRLLVGTTAAKNLRSNQWSQLRYDVPKSTADIDPVNLLNGAGSFNLMAVTAVGLEVLASGKPIDLKAPIKFDDISIFPGAPPMYVASFDSSTQEWIKAWGSVDVGQAEGALTLKPTGGDFAIQLAGWNGPSISTINFATTLDVTYRVYLPAEYAGENLWGKVFGQFGSGWKWIETPLNVSSLVAGQWNDLKVRVQFNATISAADIGTAQAFGMQIGGFKGSEVAPIKIDSISISDPNAKRTKTVVASQYKATFTKGAEGFVNAGWGGGAKAAAVDGALAVTFPEGDGGAINKADINAIPEISFMGDITVKVKMKIPASYAGSNLWMKFFFQDGNWHHFGFSPDLSAASFTPGEWTSFEFKVTSFPADFNRALKPQMFGMQFANVPAGTVMFDDIEILGNTQVDDSQPLATIPFANQAQLDAVKFDFASGTFTESGLATAKYPDWKIIPFGWAADSWTGQTGDKAPLNLSKQEGVADLTPRGQDIINSLFGIKATSVPVNFPAAAPK
jgi:hypothetical protein